MAVETVAENTGTRTRLIPVTRWSEFHPWPSVQGLRWLVFNEKENGFTVCVRRIGGRVLIDESAFFAWVSTQDAASRGV